MLVPQGESKLSLKKACCSTFYWCWLGAVVGATMCWACFTLYLPNEGGVSVLESPFHYDELMCSLFSPCTNTNCYELYWIPFTSCCTSSPKYFRPYVSDIHSSKCISDWFDLQITFFWPLGLNLKFKGCRHKANKWNLFLAQIWTGMIEYWWLVPHSPRLCIWIIQNLTNINCKWSLSL